jgi:hypothetical protein
VRAAPALFSDLKLTFRASIFTKPSRIAALDRLGFHVRTLRFNIPHSRDTFLPPLVEPETGAELSFTYTPQLQEPSTKRPRYGDAGTTDILTRQYPASFHAATNVPAFIRAFSAFVNLQHLFISCPEYDGAHRYRRSVVDFVLISLRIAIERNSLNALSALTLSPIHPGGLVYLSPILGFGASPRSASRWSRIRNLSIGLVSLPPTDANWELNQLKLVQTYLHNFQSRLEKLHFHWIGVKGPLPVKRPLACGLAAGQHPALASEVRAATSTSKALYFPNLRHVGINNVHASASEISGFVAAHQPSVQRLNFDAIDLTDGTWDEALAPMTRNVRRSHRSDIADIPIMLSPTTCSSAFPAHMERVESSTSDSPMQKSLRSSKWLAPSRGMTPTARRLRDGLLGCEQQLRRVLRGM